MHPLSIDTYMVFHPDHQEIINSKANTAAGFVLSNRPGHNVKSYRELLKKIAQLNYHNSKFRILFRGQTKDYAVNQYGEPISTSSLYPSILRQTGSGSRRKVLSDRFNALNQAEELLKATRLAVDDIHQNQLVRWALLQHYEVVPTPLLDVTASLQVALSFALQGNSPDGYLYALAVPHTHGPLSISLESMTQVIDLSQLCPPDALRPHFQSGILLSDYPTIMGVDASHGGTGMRGNNFAARLLTKFHLTNCHAWSTEGFIVTPNEILYPTHDDQWLPEIEKVKFAMKNTNNDGH